MVHATFAISNSDQLTTAHFNISILYFKTQLKTDLRVLLLSIIITATTDQQRKKKTTEIDKADRNRPIVSEFERSFNPMSQITLSSKRFAVGIDGSKKRNGWLRLELQSRHVIKTRSNNADIFF